VESDNFYCRKCKGFKEITARSAGVLGMHTVVNGIAKDVPCVLRTDMTLKCGHDVFTETLIGDSKAIEKFARLPNSKVTLDWF
jgi:hypothetical protein